MSNNEIKDIPMIKLENLSKYYVGNNEVALGLRKLNLEFEIGELVAITGESGSGKSTLLNVLSGSDSYEEGEMFICGKSTSYYDEEDWEEYRREYIGFIYQSYNLIDSYTVYENVNVALVVKGGEADNKEKVMEYLRKVGIDHLAKKKATQLSSGQKQRLAIARALAKETKIIVADEPTGNLDSENSAEVMKLLNELSVDKLVFVVTHNYDEIENYATRKIRMRDGEVEEDIKLREKKLSSDYKISDHNSDDGEVENTIKKTKKKAIAKNIAALNRRNKPVSYAFMLMFMIVVSAVFYILLGSFFSNLDNTTSKIFSTKQFKNNDITRVLVKNQDGSELTKDDIDNLKKVSKVEAVDLYDSVSDMFYCTEENVDYKAVYHIRGSKYEEPDYVTYEPIKKDKFMKTASCLEEDDLSAGNLPQNLYDIVIYSDDESVIGTQKVIYVGNEKVWGESIAKFTCTVTGILKDETEQVYFSEALGKMFVIQSNKYGKISMLNARDDLREDDLGSVRSEIVVSKCSYDTSEPKLVMQDFSTEKDVKNLADSAETEKIFNPIFIINEELTSNEIFVSEEFVSRTYDIDIDTGEHYPRDLYNVMRFYVKNSVYEEAYESQKIWFIYALNNAAAVGMVDKQMAEAGIIGPCLNGDEKGYEKLLEGKDILDKYYDIRYAVSIPLVAQEKLTNSTQNVIEVSRELYEQMFGDTDSTQAAVFLKDYAYAENVIDDIRDMGYDVVSAYQVAATEYNMDLVTKKAVSMGISLGAFILVFFVGVFIIGLIMSLGDRDISIMRLIGLERTTIDEINGYIIFRALLTGMAIGLGIIGIFYFLNVSYVVNIVKYYRIRHYIVYIVMVAVFVEFLLWRTKKRMRKLR